MDILNLSFSARCPLVCQRHSFHFSELYANAQSRARHGKWCSWALTPFLASFQLVTGIVVLKSVLSLSLTGGCSSFNPIPLDQVGMNKWPLTVHTAVAFICHSETVYIGPHRIQLIARLPPVFRGHCLFLGFHLECPLSTLNLPQNQTPFICCKNRANDRFPNLLLSFQSFRSLARVVHLNADRLASQSCVPDMIHPHCRMTSPTEGKRPCIFGIISLPLKSHHSHRRIMKLIVAQMANWRQGYRRNLTALLRWYAFSTKNSHLNLNYLSWFQQITKRKQTC